jgi:hypothetical protein
MIGLSAPRLQGRRKMSEMKNKLAQLEDAYSFLRDPQIGTAIDEIKALHARNEALLDVIAALENRIGDLRGYLMDIENLSPRDEDEGPGIASLALVNDTASLDGTVELKLLAGM